MVARLGLIGDKPGALRPVGPVGAAVIDGVEHTWDVAGSDA